MKCKYSQQLKLGKKIEMEHAHLFPKTKQSFYTGKIAKDHLKENPCYYTKLIKMEKKK
jgi:hypothetical protein